MVRSKLMFALAAVISFTSCGGDHPAGSNQVGTPPDQKRVTLLIWSDYLAPDTLAKFEARSGIKVQTTYFDANEILETKLLAGSSGFNVVVPTASFFERQIKANVYVKLDRARLPNWKNMDSRLMNQVSAHDPGNEHGVIYMWGTMGLGYNEKRVKQLLPSAPLDSWALVFDPVVASKVAKCGISVLDAPAEMLRVVLSYLGKNPNSKDAGDLAEAEKTLQSVRPYIRNIDSTEYVEALANGDLCIVVGFNGDVLQSRDRASEAKRGIAIHYAVPKEGSIIWFDMLAVPRDAPDADSAYAFIDYMMDPRVIAEVSNFKRFANGNVAADEFLDPMVKNDPGIYPPDEVRSRLTVLQADSAAESRAITRMWQGFKTGQ